jgi:hypothetical protein
MVKPHKRSNKDGIVQRNDRHSRECGNPVSAFSTVKSIGKQLDPRLRGGDEITVAAILIISTTYMLVYALMG